MLWRCDHMIMESYDHVNIWSYGQMILWFSDRPQVMIVWSHDLVVEWSTPGRPVKQKYDECYGSTRHRAPNQSQNRTRSDPESVKSTPKRSRVNQKSNPNQPETTPKRPGHPPGEPKRKNLKNTFLNKTECQKRTPFAVDFASFHYMKLTKQWFGGIATTRAHVKKVAFSSGKYWKYSEKVSSPCELRNRAIGNLLVRN